MKVRRRAMPLPEVKGRGLKGSVSITAEKAHQPKMRGVKDKIEYEVKAEEQEVEKDGKKVKVKVDVKVVKNTRPVLFPRSTWAHLGAK